jgi:hypothetical protein
MLIRSRTLEPVVHADGLVVHRSPALGEVGVPHLFTTRIGPIGSGPFDMGTLDADRRARLGAALGVEAELVDLRQVHGTDAVVVEGVPPAPPEADAIATSEPGVALLVRVADCVPVLLAAADGRRVAAVHAGWRGLVAGVVPNALRTLAAREVVGAIGPCLSPERFEVGPEVAEAFVAAGLGAVVSPGRSDRAHVDLREAARLQLERFGVRNVDVSDRCTWRDEDEFFSYRRDVTHGGGHGLDGRMAALIGVAR